MAPLVIILLLVLNFGISWWNAYVAGVNWVEMKIVGGFSKLIVWSAAIQSACGFTMCFVIVAAVIAQATGYLPDNYSRAVLELGYLMIVIPCIGTGLIITVHSWMAFARERSVMNAGVAAYNTYAQVSNIIDAVRVIPQFIGDIASTFGGDTSSDDDNPAAGWLAWIVIMIVACCLLGGILLTAEIISRTAGSRPVNLPAPSYPPDRSRLWSQPGYDRQPRR